MFRITERDLLIAASSVRWNYVIPHDFPFNILTGACKKECSCALREEAIFRYPSRFFSFDSRMHEVRGILHAHVPAVHLPAR